MPCIIVSIWGNINCLRIFDVKTHWIIGQQIKIVLDMQALFEEKEKKNHFFGRKLNKVPYIIDTIWGKINFLGIFNVKRQCITRQKNQNRAQYAGAFCGKITFFRIKDNKMPCIIGAIWGKNKLFRNFCCKNTLCYWAKKSK